MSLVTYNKKRNFKETSEPRGEKDTSQKFRFVVQRHEATRLHYDLRLELDGVLKSWAIPKGPSLTPATKRLAVQTEDHPVQYLSFKGAIPEGNYGAGQMTIWDNGTFQPVDEKHNPITEKEALKWLRNGQLKFALKGAKLKGEFALIRLKDKRNWLMIKHKDEYAVTTAYDAEQVNDKVTNPKSIASIRHGKAKKVDGFIEPMLASITKTPFDDPEWIYEIKWDGYRAVAELQNGNVRFYSRNGIDFSSRFPAILQSLKKLKIDAVLDGEIVLLNDKNMPDFQKLQHYENHLNLPLIYYVFDMLSFKGKDLLNLPLIERKELLKKLLKKNPVIRYCDHIDEEGMGFLDQAKKQGLEGIMAKRKDSLYKKGYRSKDWLKIKNVQSTEAVIVGYTAPKGERSHFGSLILANKEGREWIYRGHVGTGFSHETLATLKKTMTALQTDQSPFKTKVPLNGEVTWLKPSLVADIGYTEVTRDKIFRHPVFMRLRDEKKSSKVNQEIVADIKDVQRNGEMKVGKHRVAFTNRHKIYWPDEGYTKGDVIDFYDKISEVMLPYLKGRPLSLKRNPNGIRDDGFFHKDAGENAPSFVDVYKVKTDSSNKIVDYIVGNNKATLLYVANLGCIEINPWNSTTKKPDHPTWMVIDIDPSSKNTFKEVVDVALATRKVLSRAGVEAFCKTSGSSGLHVYVPMKNKYPYETVKNFAHLVASLVQEQLPETTTLERSLKKRGPRIYIDYLQNRSSQTLASVYSLRPVPGASVSTPLEWKEVNHKLHPSQFTIDNIFKRLEKKGDLFLSVLNSSTNIEKAMKVLGGE
ncbi:MAG: DNA ligase D [Chitinophagaceae bacterium]|nr:DNA ligase D [Chitinophagaceae bacterium]